jgi:hypothetical protein
MEASDWFNSNERQVIYEPLFLEQLEKLAIPQDRLDAALFGLEEAVSRHPEIFPDIPETSLAFARLVIYRDSPALRIFFKYDPAVVRLLFVEFDE